MKKIYSVLLTMALLLMGCQSEPALNKYDAEMFDAGFDTIIQIIAYTEDEHAFDTYKERAKELFQKYNAMFDRYQTYEGVNNIKSINDAAGKNAVKVDQEIIDLLKKTKEYGEISNHQYDVTFGAVLELWHNARNEALSGGTAAIPAMADLQEAKQHTGWDKIEIDETAQTVYINDPKASLDLGSAAKGYAAEMVAETLEAEGLRHAIINAGGNVRIIGDKPEDSSWSVGIQLPSNTENASLATVYIDKDKSFVTSGDYQRAYEVDGTMYHHIIDPHTLMPAAHMRAVTVVTEDSGIADLLSTTLFTLTYEEGSALLETLRSKGTDVEAVWVFDDTTEQPNDVELQSSGNFKLVISDGLKDSVKIKK